HVAAHNNLGFAYRETGLYDQAIASLKKAIQLNPDFATAHFNLGAALGEVGTLKPARDALQKALTLTPETARQCQAWKRTLDQMETLLGLASRLADIVKGELRSEDFQKGLLFGKLCSVKKHYQAACRLHDQALTSDPEAAKKMAPFNLL